MNIDNIKVGEIYNIRVRVIGADNDNYLTTIYVDGDDTIAGLRIPPHRISVLTPSTPKHKSRPKKGRVKPKILVCRKEELEPYSVGGSIDGCVIYKNGEYYAEFVNSIEAEQVCELLNAKHKEDNKQ